MSRQVAFGSRAGRAFPAQAMADTQRGGQTAEEPDRADHGLR